MILWPISFLTFKEGIRNRALYGISLIALLLFIANFLISGMMMRDIGKVAVDIALSTISFTGLLVVLFIGINLMAKDLDKRTIYMVLSRPISRSQYIVGKFIGIAFLILATILVLTCFSMLSIFSIKATYPDYFPRFSWQLVLIAISFETVSLLILTSVSFLFASFSSTSFITLVLTLIVYLIGQSSSQVKALVEAPPTPGLVISPFTVRLVQTVHYIFPDLSLFDVKTQAAHGIALTNAYMFWTLSYGVMYILLMVALAALIFRKKEFP